MTWLLVIGLSWTLLALGAAVVVGRGIRSANTPAAPAAWTDEVEKHLRQQSDPRSFPAQGESPAAA
ncbi:hypothetical protein [Blastococcus sp. SYSU DS1021]